VLTTQQSLLSGYETSEEGLIVANAGFVFVDDEKDTNPSLVDDIGFKK
jgi:hypothetical protein